MENPTGGFSKIESLDDYIRFASGETTDGHHVSLGLVPLTEYWLVQDGRYLGTIQIRHKPQGRVEGFESHIYYHIIPTQRAKGYGKAILRLGLLKAKEIGLRQILLVVNEKNLASIAIIQNCGGVLVKSSLEEGERLLQYRISLTNHDSGANESFAS